MALLCHICPYQNREQPNRPMKQPHPGGFHQMLFCGYPEPECDMARLSANDPYSGIISQDYPASLPHPDGFRPDFFSAFPVTSIGRALPLHNRPFSNTGSPGC